MSKKNFDKKLQDLILNDYEKDMKQADKLGIDMPKDVAQKIADKHGIKREKPVTEFGQSLRIAIIVLIFVVITTGVFIVNPEATTAVKNIFKELKFEKNNESIDFSVEEKNRTKYLFQIPEDFEIEETVTNENLIRNSYSNSQGDYITVSCYFSTMKLTLDNENCTEDKDIQIQDNIAGKLIAKNGVTTIVFSYDNYIFEIASNLTDDEIIGIAGSIQK